MKKRYDLLDVDLALFDGGEGGSSGATGGNAEGSDAGSQTGGAAEDAAGKSSDAGSIRNATRRHIAPDGLERGRAQGPYGPGDQPETEGSGRGHVPNGSVTDQRAETAQERQARYKAMVGGEFKDLYTADTQRIINERFKETRGLQEALNAQGPVMDFLMAKYKTQDPAALMAAIQADESQWQAMADAAGKTVEQFRSDYLSQRQREAMDAQLRRSQQELFYQRQMAAWGEEAKAVQAAYPDFDFEAACQDKDFLRLLQSKVPMRLAYEVMHMTDIVAGAKKAAADERERAVTEAIRARGGRPPENGGSAQNGVTSAVDVGHLTREQRADIAKRAARGERITFQ